MKLSSAAAVYLTFFLHDLMVFFTVMHAEQQKQPGLELITIFQMSLYLILVFLFCLWAQFLLCKSCIFFCYMSCLPSLLNKV